MNKTIMALLLSVSVCQSAQAALLLSADEDARREEIAGICMLASQGVYEAATKRQSGVSKANAKTHLTKEFKKIEKNFTNKDLIAFMNQTWNNGLDIVYGLPVHDKKADKEAFVSQAVAASFEACFNDLDN